MWIGVVCRKDDGKEEYKDEVLSNLTTKAIKKKFLISATSVSVIREYSSPKATNSVASNFAKYTEDLLKHDGIIDKDQRIFEANYKRN